MALRVQRRGGRARAWPGRYIIREQRTSVPYNQNSASAEAVEAIFLSADVMDRWTDAGGRGTDGLTHDETEKRKTEEVKKLSGEIGATKEQKIFIQMHALHLPSSDANTQVGSLSLSRSSFDELESRSFSVCGVEYPTSNNSVAFKAASIHASRRIIGRKRVVFHARLGAN